MKSRIIAAAALAGLIAFPGLAMASTDEVFGQSATAVEQTLTQRGYNVERVEEWGQLLRAFVQNRDGSTAMLYFDPDTLQQVGAS